MKSATFLAAALVFAAAPVFLRADDAPSAKVREDYDAALRKADLPNHPERHEQLAEWCRARRWSSQADRHQVEFRRHQFFKARDGIQGTPSPADLRALADLAAKLKLPDEEAEARERCIAAELRDRRARVKGGDAASLKAVLAWALKAGAGPAARPLAREVLAIDPQHEPARLFLGHFRRDGAWADPWGFDGAISREVLENYLSRSLCVMDFHGHAQRDEYVRMILNVGAKFIGLAALAWSPPSDDDAHFRTAAEAAALCHKGDPDIILQAGVFETAYKGVEAIPVPAWAFEAFGLPPEKRNFRYEAMLYGDGRMRNRWGPDGAVPDMSQIETRMWFYYRARRYIDAGYEAIRFGQVHLMDQMDPDHRSWRDMLGRVRGYAKVAARRHFVLCDAHTHGIIEEGKLLFDLHAFPMRIKEVPGTPQHAVLEMGHIDSPWDRSRGGITPSGWSCDHLPYLAEVDNWEPSGREGQNIGGIWVWGYDEIGWFAHQPEDYRNRWLRSAWRWVRENDPNGWFQIPGLRCLAAPVGGQTWYMANARGPACPTGFNQEATIRAIWREEEDPAGKGTGLRGDYFGARDFTDLKRTRTDAAVDFDWGEGPPDPSMPADGFSVRWTGYVQAPASETYTFHVRADNGARLWVNGRQVLYSFAESGAVEESGTIFLMANRKHFLKLELDENTGGAAARLMWSSPSQAKEVVPKGRLYPPLAPEAWKP